MCAKDVQYGRNSPTSLLDLSICTRMIGYSLSQQICRHIFIWKPFPLPYGASELIYMNKKSFENEAPTSKWYISF
jgi:hypothetical protein